MADPSVMLINTRPNYNNSVVYELRRKPYVESADIVLGKYNVIALVKIERKSDIEERQRDIRKILGITCATTLVSRSIRE
jgi:hypothetical protein